MKANKPICNEIKEDEPLPIANGKSAEFISSPKIISGTLNIKDTSSQFAGNLIINKLTHSKYIVIPTFESIDGWVNNCYLGGFLTPSIGGVRIQTASTLNAIGAMSAQPIGGGIGEEISAVLSFAKNPSMQVMVNTDWGAAGSLMECYITMGARPLVDSNGCGFKIANQKIYSFYAETNETLTELTGVVLYNGDPKWNNLQIITNKVGSATTMQFYVNGVLKNTVTTTTMSNWVSALMSFYIKNNHASNVVLDVKNIIFYQDL